MLSKHAWCKKVLISAAIAAVKQRGGDVDAGCKHERLLDADFAMICADCALPVRMK